MARRLAVTPHTLRSGCAYLFQPAPKYYPSRRDLTRMGVVPPIESCPIPIRNRNRLPQFAETMRKVVHYFEIANSLKLTGSGAEIKPTEWAEIENPKRH
jgi:hypothetical protein